jgi:putative peptide zinc metalloprotease protein
MPSTPAVEPGEAAAPRPAGDALFSNSWYRVAPLKPRLRGHVRIHRHVYRGEVWYVVEDRIAGRYHRFNPTAYGVIGLFDGRRSLQQVWDRLVAGMNDHTPTQDELVRLVGQLYASDLIQCDVTPDVAELFERGGRQRRSRWMQRFGNPVALRFPLLDPDRLLGRILAAAGPLAGWPGVLLWLAAVLPALALAPSHWSELTGNFNERLLAVDNLLLLAVLFPLLKALHELGHGLATKRFGGEVHEMGVMLLVFFPVPYVDASSASAFASRWPRLLVGAAGMLTELFVAAFAFHLWLLMEPGFVRSLAFNVMILAGITTVMFNANPLLRYDGYYILADAIESPNLGQRATEHWRWLLRRHLFGVHDAEAPVATAGERRWFTAYAPLAFAYRMFVLASIVVFVASRYFFVGVLIAAWGLFMSVVLPFVRGLKKTLTDPALDSRGPRVRAVLLGAAGLLGLALFVIPLPSHTVVDGVVWPPEKAVLRAQGAGFVATVRPPAGGAVQAGDLVIETVDLALDARRAEQRARLAHAQARHESVFGLQPARAAQLAEEVRAAQAALDALDEEAARLSLRAGAAGTLLLPRAADLPGRWLKRGEIVGHVDTGEPPTVRAIVPQWQLQPGDAQAGAVQVRLPQQPGATWDARLLRSVPAAARELPSAALGTAGGGEQALDPRDPRGLQGLQAHFEYELALPPAMPHRQIGTRVQVRFEHPAEPLAWRLGRAVRRLFLSQFQV